MENSVVKRRSGRPSKSNTGVSSEINKTLLKSMQILERLAESDYGLSLSELSMQLGIAPATIHRLLYTFEKLGYIYHDHELGLWFIGVKTFEVGSAFLNKRDLVSIAKPIMHELVESSGETVNLSIVDNGEIVYISQVESSEMMRMIVKVGGRAPIHASGAGKAMLTTFSDQNIRQILKKRGLQRFTPNTIDSSSRLNLELAENKKRGFAIDDEEHAVGLRCVAAPIYDETSIANAAISISGPKIRIPDNRLMSLGSSVTQAALKITHGLGGQLPD